MRCLRLARRTGGTACNVVRPVLVIVRGGAEEEQELMGLHPDDPSFNVRGRPRIVKDSAALKRVVDIVPSASNGITFCPGSLATNRDNDVLAIAEQLWPHFVFCHFRNIRFLAEEELDGE